MRGQHELVEAVREILSQVERDQAGVLRFRPLPNDWHAPVRGTGLCQRQQIGMAKIASECNTGG